MSEVERVNQSDLEAAEDRLEQVSSQKTCSRLTCTGQKVGMPKFYLVDDGTDVNAHILLELKLSSFVVADATFPCGLKSSNRMQLMEAFEPWNTYIKESEDVKAITYLLKEEKWLLPLALAVMLFVLGWMWLASNRSGWAVTLILQGSGTLITVAFVCFTVHRVRCARSAFHAVSKQARVLATRLETILKGDGIKVHPICQQSKNCMDICRFWLDMTVSVWTRTKHKSIDAASEDTDDPCGREGEQCAICLQDLEQSQLVKVLPCYHKYHAACADSWLKRSMLCPLCKRATPESMPSCCTFVV